MRLFRDDRLRVSSVGVVVPLAGILLFAVSFYFVRNLDASAMEEMVFRLFYDLPDGLHRALQLLGAVGMVALLLLVGIYCWANRDPLRGVLLVGALALGFGLNFLAKLWLVSRARPSELLGITPRDVSDPTPIGFPSGHMAITVTLAVIAMYLLPARYRPWVWIVPLVVAAGRMYSGEHMPLDIVGGLAIGLFVGGLAELTTRLRRRPALTPQ